MGTRLKLPRLIIGFRHIWWFCTCRFSSSSNKSLNKNRNRGICCIEIWDVRRCGGDFVAMTYHVGRQLPSGNLPIPLYFVILPTLLGLPNDPLSLKDGKACGYLGGLKPLLYSPVRPDQNPEKQAHRCSLIRHYGQGVTPSNGCYPAGKPSSQGTTSNFWLFPTGNSKYGGALQAQRRSIERPITIRNPVLPSDCSMT